MTRLKWNNFAKLILQKGAIAITGFGTPLLHGEDVVVPLFLEGEESGPCRILLKFPLVEVSLVHPYDSLKDRSWSTIAHMKFLQKKTNIPVPHVYYFYLEGVDVLGGNCPWSLEERVAGVPLKFCISKFTPTQIQRIGHAWGDHMAAAHSLRFGSVGGLRTILKGERAATDTIGADPEGNHLTMEHYASPINVGNGISSLPRDKPTDALGHLFSLATTSVVRFLREISYLGQGPDELEEYIWSFANYLYLRHLHLFITEFAKSDFCDNYYTFDIAQLDLGNIHVDEEGTICGVVGGDGMNIVPTHIALRLPRSFQGIPLFGEEQPLIPCQNYPKYALLAETIARQFERRLLKNQTFGKEKDGKIDVCGILAAGAAAKTFEILLYRFNGRNDTDSLEFRGYMLYAHNDWNNIFGKSSRGSDENKYLRRFVMKGWKALAASHPQFCMVPCVPSLYPQRGLDSPFTQRELPPSPSRRVDPNRLRRTQSHHAKSSFDNSPNRITNAATTITGGLKQGWNFIKRVRGGDRSSY